MTEEQIEARVERWMDHADRCLMAYAISQDTYDKIVRDIREWTDERYRELERNPLRGKRRD